MIYQSTSVILSPGHILLLLNLLASTEAELGSGEERIYYLVLFSVNIKVLCWIFYLQKNEKSLGVSLNYIAIVLQFTVFSLCRSFILEIP